MIRVTKEVQINGVKATMLFTPRLFVIAEKKDIKLTVDTTNVMHTLAAYADICYCAALNHWTMDNDMDDFQLKRVDFHEWAAANQEEFGKTMIIAAEAITGKSVLDVINEQKSSETVKKKSKSHVITRLWRRFWSGNAE